MNRLIQFIFTAYYIAASALSITASTPSDQDDSTILRNLMSTIARDLKSSSTNENTLPSAFSSLLQNAGLTRNDGATTIPPSLEQIFSVLPRPPLFEGPFINNTSQAAVDVAVINLVSSSLSLASGLCNAAGERVLTQSNLSWTDPSHSTPQQP